MAILRGYRDLIVYQKSYALAMKIFEITKTFPKEEKYSLIDQIRRSSRSIPANIAESWAKRIYPKVFVNKLSDALGEEHETEVWLDFSRDCQYISSETHEQFIAEYDEVRRMLISMINTPDKFCK
jgi:four helix bundle protein